MKRPPADRSRYGVPTEITVRWEMIRSALRQRRIDLGLTQVELSRRMGRSEDFVSVMENQSGNPNIATLLIWAQALGGTMTPEFDDE